MEKQAKGTYRVRESFDPANKMLANITCAAIAKFKYSTKFQTHVETRHANCRPCDVTFEIWVRFIFCQRKFIFALGLKEEENKCSICHLTHISSIQINRHTLYSHYVAGTRLGTLDAKTSEAYMSPPPGLLIQQEKQMCPAWWADTQRWVLDLGFNGQKCRRTL